MEGSVVRGATHKFIARKRNDLATRGEESGMAITIRHRGERLYSAWWTAVILLVQSWREIRTTERAATRPN